MEMGRREKEGSRSGERGDISENFKRDIAGTHSDKKRAPNY